MVAKKFYNGGGLKTGIFCKDYRIIRPYTAKGINGAMHSTKCNYTQIGLLSGVSKDVARTSIERVVKQLSKDVRKRGVCEIVIPTVGVFSVRGSIAAVAFDNGLESDAKMITNKNLDYSKRKEQSRNFVTVDAMDQF